MEKPKERLQKVIDEYGLRSVARLAHELGLKTASSVWDLFKKDPEQFNLPMIQRLQSSFPGLNPEWIKTGEGEMFVAGFSPRQDIRGGHHNRNSQYNFHMRGNEKIIKPDGTVSIEPTGPQTETGEYAANLEREVETLRRENAEKDRRIATLEGEVKSKNEFIQQLLGKLKG